MSEAYAAIAARANASGIMVTAAAVEEIAGMLAASPSHADALTRIDPKTIAAAVVQSACETDPADAEHPDTVSIGVADLEAIVRVAVEHALEALESSKPGERGASYDAVLREKVDA